MTLYVVHQDTFKQSLSIRKLPGNNLISKITKGLNWKLTTRLFKTNLQMLRSSTIDIAFLYQICKLWTETKIIIKSAKLWMIANTRGTISGIRKIGQPYCIKNWTEISKPNHLFWDKLMWSSTQTTQKAISK